MLLEGNANDFPGGGWGQCRELLECKVLLATVVHRVAREGIIGLSPGRQVSVCIGVHVSKEHIFVRTASSSRNTKRITY